jgi:sulfoxide reductase heme-binding subunit YedZ
VSGLTATTGPSAYWYLTRGTGTVSLLLLTGATVLGIASSTRWSLTRWPRFVVAGMHRNLTLLAIAFVGVHVLTTIADGFAPIGLRDAILPFASPYRPFWLGLGAVAFDLLLALAITSMLRVRIGLRIWRGLHWLAYVTWPIALLHALGTGSDARAAWLELVAFGSIALVALAAGWRILTAVDARPPLRLAAGLALLVVPIALVAWYRGGPMQHGWASRAGTPRSLLPTSGGK